MKLKILILFIIHVMISIVSIAQSNLKTLKKGDYIDENMELGKMINYHSKTAKFSDFKGKLIILDFWATWCVPCVAALPKLDSLQKEFGSKIAIIPINAPHKGDNEAKVKAFFESKAYGLPSVVEDQILTSLFPHGTIPHEVWIAQNGQILSTSTDEEVTAANINEYFKTGKLNIKEKVDDLHPDYSNLSTDEQEGAFYSSILSMAKKTSGSTTSTFDSIKKKNLVSFTGKCMSAFHIYSYILAMGRFNGKNPMLNPTRFIIENKDSTCVPLNTWQDFNKPRNNWKNNWIGNEKGYNYQIKIPSPGVPDSLFYRKYILDDLNRCLDFTGRIEKRKVSSWIIVKATKQTPFLSDTKDTSAAELIYNNEVSEEYIEKVNNMNFSKFIYYISASDAPFREFYVMPPLFNETGFPDDKITLNNLHLRYRKDKASHKPLNFEEWRAALQRNGLDIKVEDREVEVMILTKKETPTK